MPFKLKLKNKYKYNVMSKSLFVISVELLDNINNVDCTLSNESKGSECLENVCQRISINQPEFFGLRYIAKGTNDELRWVDLDRPLFRQLEKYAANSKMLYLRVMYYVISGVSLITDEVTRNYYFLQLKQDVVEGRISCDPKQAVILANYSRQAEYGNYQDRHTVEYLKTLLSFPKHLIESGLLEVLTEEVIQHHDEVHNITQGAAEELYISACQQLDGYGQETFTARNDDGAEVMLGISVSGIIVANNGNHKFYPWRDITNVVNHKRTFNIECTDQNHNVGFTLNDAETGRYVWKLCVLQHTFFMAHEQQQTTASQVNLSLFQNIPENFNDSREDLLAEEKWHSETHISVPNSNTNLSINNSQQNWVTSSESLINASNLQSRTSLQTSSALDVNQSINRGQSSSCLDLSKILPYRPPPDYEVAIQQKYPQQQIQTYPDVTHHTQILGGPQYSDVTDYNNLTHRFKMMRVAKPPPPYPANRLSSTSTPDLALASHRGLVGFRGSQVSGSSPDLVSSRTFLNPHQNYMYITPHGQPILYTAAGVGLANGQRLRHSHSFLPHATYENLNFIETQPQTLFQPGKPLPNNLIYRTSSAAAAIAQQIDMELYMQQKQLPLNLSNSQINEPIYENVPLPSYNPSTNIIETRDRASSVVSAPGIIKTLQQQTTQKQQPTQLQIHKKPIPLERNDSTSTTSIITNSFSNNSINSNDMMKYKQQLLINNNNSSNQNQNFSNNGLLSGAQLTNSPSNVKIEGSSGSFNNLSVVKTDNITFGNKTNNFNSGKSENNLNNVKFSGGSQTFLAQQLQNQQNYASSASTSNLSDHSLNLQQKRHNSTTILDTSTNSNSSNVTFNTTTTTTDSGISSGGRKKNKFWNILSGGSKNKNSSSSSDKQKSATLGREKDKNKKLQQQQNLENSLNKHRWSTGLPKLQPLPANISKESLCQLLEQKLNDTELFLEFERIPKRRDNAKYDCALLEENRNKNSDPNFLPYDENRVRLTATRDNRFGYVNASHITSTVGQKQRFYILAQSAHNEMTSNLFWQCVWEADVYLLIQLTDDLPYVPPNSDKCLEFGQYQVWREFSQETNRCVTSKLRICHTQSRRYRSVWHLSIGLASEWSDQNCPTEVSHFLKFLEELNSVRIASTSEVPPGHNTNPPVLIHCNGGGGGVVLVADLLLYTLDHNQDLDIPRVIGQLRQQRDNIIPSLAQYKFIYALLIHYLKQTRLI